MIVCSDPFVSSDPQWKWSWRNWYCSFPKGPPENMYSSSAKSTSNSTFPMKQKHKLLRLSWIHVYLPCKKIIIFHIKLNLPVWPLLKSSPSAKTFHQFLEKWIASTKVELDFCFLNLKSIGDCLLPFPHTSYPSRDPHILGPYKLF